MISGLQWRDKWNGGYLSRKNDFAEIPRVQLWWRWLLERLPCHLWSLPVNAGGAKEKFFSSDNQNDSVAFSNSYYVRYLIQLFVSVHVERWSRLEIVVSTTDFPEVVIIASEWNDFNLSNLWRDSLHIIRHFMLWTHCTNMAVSASLNEFNILNASDMCPVYVFLAAVQANKVNIFNVNLHEYFWQHTVQ